jgi:hypothetical protein
MNILKKECSPSDANDKSLPINSYIITYVVKGKELYDIVQASSFVEVFDKYYDEYGKGAIKDIRWSSGRVNPKTYGIPPKENKKRR